jgi:hypothetical protein
MSSSSEDLTFRWAIFCSLRWGYGGSIVSVMDLVVCNRGMGELGHTRSTIHLSKRVHLASLPAVLGL